MNDPVPANNGDRNQVATVQIRAVRRDSVNLVCRVDTIEHARLRPPRRVGADHHHTTNQKGAIAESQVAAAAIKLGIEVYTPILEGGRFDMIFATP